MFISSVLLGVAFGVGVPYVVVPAFLALILPGVYSPFVKGITRLDPVSVRTLGTLPNPALALLEWAKAIDAKRFPRTVRSGLYIVFNGAAMLGISSIVYLQYNSVLLAVLPVSAWIFVLMVVRLSQLGASLLDEMRLLGLARRLRRRYKARFAEPGGASPIGGYAIAIFSAMANGFIALTVALPFGPLGVYAQLTFTAYAAGFAFCFPRAREVLRERMQDRRRFMMSSLNHAISRAAKKVSEKTA